MTHSRLYYRRGRNLKKYIVVAIAYQLAIATLNSSKDITCILFSKPRHSFLAFSFAYLDKITCSSNLSVQACVSCIGEDSTAKLGLMDRSLVHRVLPPNPDLLIEGQRYRSSTFPMEIDNLSYDNGLPIIDDNDQIPLGELLRNCAQKGVVSPEGDFWSLKLLRHILSRDRILS